MDITTLLNIGGGNLKLEVTAEDLTKFAKDVVEMTLSEKQKLDAELKSNAPEEETWLSSAEVRSRFGIAKSTLYVWINKGYLTPKKIGGQNRFALSEIRKIQQSNECEEVSDESET